MHGGGLGGGLRRTSADYSFPCSWEVRFCCYIFQFMLGVAGSEVGTISQEPTKLKLGLLARVVSLPTFV